LRTHIDYTAWASRKLLAAAAQLSPEHLNQNFGTADRSVLGTLAHTFAADRLWLPRITGGPNPGFITDADRSLAVLQNDWPALHERWKEWARGLTDERAGTAITYKDLKGNQWTQPLWQLVLHMVNHGTHHRGQAAGFLRIMEAKPSRGDPNEHRLAPRHRPRAQRREVPEQVRAPRLQRCADVRRLCSAGCRGVSR
jgi:uncharacterized damage-inducible protein DinB